MGEKNTFKNVKISQFKITNFYKSRQGRNAQVGITPVIPAKVQYKSILTFSGEHRGNEEDNANPTSGPQSRSKIRTPRGNAAIEFHGQNVHITGTIKARTVDLKKYTPWDWFLVRSKGLPLWREQPHLDKKSSSETIPKRQDFLPNTLAVWEKVHILPLPEILNVLPELEVTGSKELKVFGISI